MSDPLNDDLARECMRQRSGGYVIAYDEKGERYIRFRPCNVVSYNANDIRNVYCARCGRFIDDVLAWQRATPAGSGTPSESREG